MSRLHRRTLLKGMLGGGLVTIGLPPLEIFFERSRLAHASDGFPKRFGLFFWGNGNNPKFWTPETLGPDWTPSHQLEPLADIKHKVSVISGTNVAMKNRVPHFSGAGAVLTGSPLIVKGGEDYTFAEPSIDQIIASSVGRDTRFKSLEVGVVSGPGLSYNGPNSLNPAEEQPGRLFDRLFNPGNGFREPGSDAPPDPKLRLRRSVLDAVLADADRLNARLGTEDQQRLDQHLTGVRELELRIARLEEDPPSLAACAAPAAPEGPFANVDGRPPISDLDTAMIELLAMALACDQTRVFSFYISKPVGNPLFLDAPAGHHQLTHNETGDQPTVDLIVRFIIGELGRLLKRFDQIQEGDGTLLDHSAILATSDVSFGRTHSIEDFPVLIGGSACGAIKTGVHVDAFGENTSKVGLSLLRAMDVPASEFGREEGRVTQGIEGIEA